MLAPSRCSPLLPSPPGPSPPIFVGSRRKIARPRSRGETGGVVVVVVVVDDVLTIPQRRRALGHRDARSLARSLARTVAAAPRPARMILARVVQPVSRPRSWQYAGVGPWHMLGFIPTHG
jgi:hypothetical protein